jgi:DNA-directed RNA polymerase subunit RPC12/RpoP
MLIFILVLLVVNLVLTGYLLYLNLPENLPDQKTSKPGFIAYLKCQFCNRTLPDVIKMPDGRIACSQCRVRVLNSI